MAECCGNCRFYFDGTTSAKAFEPAGGMCRRYAPQGPIIGVGSWQVFPPMSAGHWCGDWSLKPGYAAEMAERVAA